jgi:hypothetical protein
VEKLGTSKTFPSKNLILPIGIGKLAITKGYKEFTS